MWRRWVTCCALVAALAGGAAHGQKSKDWTGTPWDPALVTPGVHLNFVELSRKVAHSGDWVPNQRWLGTTVVTYAIKGSGFPLGKEYRLWLWPSYLSPVRTQYVVHFNPAGDVLTDQNSILHITLGAYHKGERETIGLESTDGDVRANATIFPFPLQAADRGCRLTLEMISDDGRAFAATGAGFHPGGQVEAESRSDGEVLRDRLIAGRDGTIHVVIAPAAIAGHMQASYQIKTAYCSVKVQYAWGSAALVPQ